MWRRHSKGQLDVAELAAGPEARSEDETPAPVDSDFTPFEQWEGRWAGAEEERVARWLVDKVGPRSRSVLEHQVDRLSVALQPERRPAGAAFAFEDPWVGGAGSRAGASTAERAELASGVAHLREEREELTAGLAAHRMDVAAERQRLDIELDEARAAAEEERRRLADLDALRESVDEERRRLVAAQEAHRAELEERHRQQAALAAERAEVEEQRRQLAAAVQSDQEEIDRVRRLQMETRARLDAEIADLQRRRDQLAPGER